VRARQPLQILYRNFDGMRISSYFPKISKIFRAISFFSAFLHTFLKGSMQKYAQRDQCCQNDKNFSMPRKKCLQLYEGEMSPILTNAFLQQIRNSLKHLSNSKVLYVTKDCLKNLARARNAMYAQKRKNSIFGAVNFTPSNF